MKHGEYVCITRMYSIYFYFALTNAFQFEHIFFENLLTCKASGEIELMRVGVYVVRHMEMGRGIGKRFLFWGYKVHMLTYHIMEVLMFHVLALCSFTNVNDRGVGEEFLFFRIPITYTVLIHIIMWMMRNTFFFSLLYSDPE